MFNRLLAISGLLLMLGACSTMSGEAPAPASPTILTITGNITNPNRGPFEEFRDAVFAVHEKTFTEAAAYDRATLAALPQVTHHVGYKDWPSSYDFTGPLLADVLALAGAEGETVIVTALDAYAGEIPLSDIDAYDIILALEWDGAPLAMGGHGPIWVIYPLGDHPELEERDESLMVWAAYLIEVQ